LDKSRPPEKRSSYAHIYYTIFDVAGVNLDPV
jgi:hypothetical protein